MSQYDKADKNNPDVIDEKEANRVKGAIGHCISNTALYGKHDRKNISALTGHEAFYRIPWRKIREFPFLNHYKGSLGPANSDNQPIFKIKKRIDS